MTIDQFIEKQRKRINKIESQALKIAALDTHRKMAVRIFIEGEATNESLIGSYNTTKPLYVNPNKSPRSFPVGGKTGKTFAKTIHTDSGSERIKYKHKTAFFYSYRDYKKAIGQPVDKVRLRLFGRMQSDFISGLRRVSSTEYVSVFKDRHNLLKARGQELRFQKKIFKLSESEKKHFNDTLRLAIRRILNA